MQIDEHNLDAYALGCGILGAGGGGETRTATLIARETIRRYGPVKVIGIGEVPSDSLIMPCGLIGAPTVSLEKIPSGSEGDRLIDEMQRLLGRPVSALMCMELAGSNGLYPLIWAARHGLPVVDADGVGRAFPQLQLMSMSIAQIDVAPVVLTDERDLLVTLGGALDVEWAERLARSIAVAFGGRANIALFPMRPEVAAGCTIGGSLSLAVRLGAALSDPDTDPLVRLERDFEATVVLRGHVADVERNTSGGFVRGSMVVEGSGSDGGRLLRIEFQNENLVGIEAGEIVAATPDILSVLDATTGEPIATEEIAYGQRVVVVVIPAAPFWYEPAGMRVAGPAAFGYEFASGGAS